MFSPLPPIIINDVVFALSSGAFRSGGAQMTAAQRAQRSKPAVLYALDASTGKELWNSGSTITSNSAPRHSAWRNDSQTERRFLSVIFSILAHANAYRSISRRNYAPEYTLPLTRHLR